MYCEEEHSLSRLLRASGDSERGRAWARVTLRGAGQPASAWLVAGPRMHGTGSPRLGQSRQEEGGGQSGKGALPPLPLC